MTKKKKPSHRINIKCYRNKRLEDVPTLYEAAEFFLDELLKRCTLEYKLNIEISLRNGAVVGEDGSTNVGMVGEETIRGKTWYKMDLSNDEPFLELLSTLAHELVHVVQFATGRLKAEDDWIWDGVSYGPNAYKDVVVDNDLPWEYDAYTKEVELSKKFVKKYYSR